VVNSLIEELRGRRDRARAQKQMRALTAIARALEKKQAAIAHAREKKLAAIARAREERRLQAASRAKEQKRRTDIRRILSRCFQRAYDGNRNAFFDKRFWQYRESLDAMGLDYEKCSHPLLSDVKTLKAERTSLLSEIAADERALQNYFRNDRGNTFTGSRLLKEAERTASSIPSNEEENLQNLMEMSAHEIREMYGLHSYSDAKIFSFRRGRLAALGSGAQVLTAYVQNQKIRELAEKLRLNQERLKQVTRTTLRVERKIQKEGTIRLRVSWSASDRKCKRVSSQSDDYLKLRWFSVGGGRQVFRKIFARAKKLASRSKMKILFRVVNQKEQNLLLGKDVLRIPKYIVPSALIARLRVEGFVVSVSNSESRVATLLMSW